METADVVIIGGGCIGTSIALQLARRRAGRIVLLERHRLAAGSTGRSSALVRQHYTHPALVNIASRALHIFRHFQDEIGGTAGFRTTGFLALVGPEDVAALRENARMQRDLGVDTRVLNPDSVLEVDPRLNVADVGAAAFEPESGYADGHSTTYAFADAARALGVEIRQHAPVTGLVVRDGRVAGVQVGHETIMARAVVIAAGYHSRDLLLPLGIDLPIRPVRHEVMLFERPATFGPPHCAVIDFVQRAYMRPEGSCLTLVGSADAYQPADDSDPDAHRTVDACTPVRFGQRFAHRFAGVWDFGIRLGYTGIYDVTPDGQPVLGPASGYDGLYLACGFSGHGFKLSPVIGELLAEAMCDGESTLVDLRLFRASRFAEGDLLAASHPYTQPTTGSI